MMHARRPKVIKAKLEKELDRYSKRIQKLASKAYQIRQMLEDLAIMEQSLTPAGRAEIVKDFKEETNAVHSPGTEGSPTSWTADSDTGQPQLFDNILTAAILPEQSEKLPSIE